MKRKKTTALGLEVKQRNRAEARAIASEEEAAVLRMRCDELHQEILGLKDELEVAREWRRVATKWQRAYADLRRKP